MDGTETLPRAIAKTIVASVSFRETDGASGG